jgi:hypothetical protein
LKIILSIENDEEPKQPENYMIFELSYKLRERRCIFLHLLSKKAEDLALMRMVIKENSSRVIADILFDHGQKNARFFPGFGLSR